MSAFKNVIQWYESNALDKPELRSPTPCPRGVYCQYKLPNPETKELELACCRMVHPGEEGNGRRLFPARQTPDGRQQPACVRLTGKAGFYERCRLKQPWRVWATEHEIPLPPTDIPWVQVERGPVRRGPKPAQRSSDGFDPVNEEPDYVSEVARASQEMLDAVMEFNGQAPLRAATQSPVDWPSLQNRTAPPPCPHRPPPLNLSSSISRGVLNYGFNYGIPADEGGMTPLLPSMADLSAQGAMDAVD